MQVVENEFELLLVSQFTLFGKLKGNKLEFVKVGRLCCWIAGWSTEEVLSGTVLTRH